MHCREILFTPHRSARTKEYGVRLRSYEASKLPIFALWPIFPIQNPEKSTLRWPASSPRVHRRMITIVPCGSRRSKGVPSSSGVFHRRLVGELGPPNLPKFSLMANGYIHTECYCTPRHIWTRVVWKRAIMRTYVLSYQISSPLPQNPIWGNFQCKTNYRQSYP